MRLVGKQEGCKDAKLSEQRKKRDQDQHLGKHYCREETFVGRLSEVSDNRSSAHFGATVTRTPRCDSRAKTTLIATMVATAAVTT